MAKSHVGLTADELEQLGTPGPLAQGQPRDFGLVLARKKRAAPLRRATLIAAHAVG
jgi:pseudouridine-5'-phosphate glycosidase